MIYTSQFSEIQVPRVSIFKLMEERCKRYSDTVAMVDATTGAQVTYSDLSAKINNHVHRLLNSNTRIAKGDVIAILSPNSLDYMIWVYAILSLGGVVMPINTLLIGVEIQKQLEDSGAKAIIVHSELEHKLDGLDILRLDIACSDGSVNLVDISNCCVEPEDPAFLVYSSGTTGTSKGVILTHQNIVSNLVQLETMENITPGERCLCMLPMYHIYGLNVVCNYGLYRGLTIVLLKYQYNAMLDTILKYQIQHLYLVPPIILSLVKNNPCPDLSCVKSILSGAAPLAESVVNTMVERYPHVMLRQAYGMTEASPILTYQPVDRLVGNPTSVGMLAPTTKLRIINEQFVDTSLGELIFSGPQVMQGYLNNEEATKNTLRDGWLHTGDVGYYQDGYVFVTDRIKELIKYKGYQVAPAELEAILLEHPLVQDAVVVGPLVDNEEQVTAHVVLEHFQDVEQTLNDICTFVNNQVAPYKKIRAIHQIDKIPKSASGKILRRLIK